MKRRGFRKKHKLQFSHVKLELSVRHTEGSIRNRLKLDQREQGRNKEVYLRGISREMTVGSV